MVARKFTVPFAAAGDLVDIPTDPQSDGSVSMTNGWGSDYEKPNDDPSYKPVGRGEMNRALHDPTEAIGEIQLYGFPLWGVWPGGYPIEACVSHGGKAWSSTVASNETEPGTEGAKWEEIITRTKLASALALLDFVTDSELAVALAQFRLPALLAGNGYATIPTDDPEKPLILQWGEDTGSSGSGALHSFPVAFPNAGFAIFTSPKVGASTSGQVGVSFVNNAQFRLYYSASGNTGPWNWFAIGD